MALSKNHTDNSPRPRNTYYNLLVGRSYPIPNLEIRAWLETTWFAPWVPAQVSSQTVMNVNLTSYNTL